MRDAIGRIPDLLLRLYAIVDELEALFPGRRFTPDGHLVGSLGEVWAAYLYGIELSAASEATHDGRAPDGRLVQVKATQGRAIALRAEPHYLIALKLGRHGEPAEIFNGPGSAPWAHAGPMQKNGQRAIQLSTLAKLATAVPAPDRVPRAAL